MVSRVMIHITKPALFSNHQIRVPRNTLTEKDPANKNMCKVSVLAILTDIREGQHIKLLLTTAACPIDRKENRERQAAANKANDR
jgi:hypothetical protein